MSENESLNNPTDISVEKADKFEGLDTFRLQFKLNGINKKWDFIKLPDAFFVLVFNKTRQVVVLVNQFRPTVYGCSIPNIKEAPVIDEEKYPIRQGYALELCSGSVEDSNPELSAQNAIRKKLNYKVSTADLRLIFKFSNVGVATNRSNVFYVEVEDGQLAEENSKALTDEDPYEIVEMTVVDFRKLITSPEEHMFGGFLSAGLWFFSNIVTNNS